MKNTFGESVSLTLFGESHGAAVGAVLDGFAPGVPVREDAIGKQLQKRRPAGPFSTRRVEKDEWRIVSGVFNGKTTGTPLCLLIPNEDTRSADYERTRFLPRPGHADYTAYEKYHGYEDYRGGGHFSGRITAAIVAVGGILLPALRAKGISVGTHLLRLGEVSDRAFSDCEKDVQLLEDKDFAVLDPEAEEKMKEEILRAAAEGDSVGGVLETVVCGLPAGVGEPFFDTLEGQLSKAFFAVPGVKGVQFGDGFDLCCGRGSRYNDAFALENGKVVTVTNHNGGINGGISNGMPIVARCAVKPTPSIFLPQQTVDLQENRQDVLALAGRHDPAIIHRARVVIDSMAALVLCDQLALRFGVDYLAPER